MGVLGRCNAVTVKSSGKNGVVCALTRKRQDD